MSQAEVTQPSTIGVASEHLEEPPWSLKLSQPIYKLRELGKASRGMRKRKKSAKVLVAGVSMPKKWKICSETS